MPSISVTLAKLLLCVAAFLCVLSQGLPIDSSRISLATDSDYYSAFPYPMYRQLRKRNNAEVVNHLLKNFSQLNRLGDVGRR
ncbi:nlp-37 [Pristionchus pacificus]|uniref:Nlp-37 n=1 Tax=Pristionchus pacificus TaxID=54126 RepID=A0A2A6B498_PRIPA|nr:nlp-37 [Pristionchus pacificus]|eukprot:PDM60706.1 nlp-37 [Pristionchus pacificus]